MDYVNCSGSEVNLWDCVHFTHNYGCTHSNDVGVRCQPGESCHYDDSNIHCCNISSHLMCFAWEIINPRRACTAKVMVVVPCVCVSVCLSVRSFLPPRTRRLQNIGTNRFTAR